MSQRGYHCFTANNTDPSVTSEGSLYIVFMCRFISLLWYVLSLSHYTFFRIVSFSRLLFPAFTPPIFVSVFVSSCCILFGLFFVSLTSVFRSFFTFRLFHFSFNVRYLHDVQKWTHNLRLFLLIIKLKKCWTDFCKISYGHYAIGVDPKIILFDISQWVIVI